MNTQTPETDIATTTVLQTEAATEASVNEFMAALESLAEDVPPTGLAYTRDDIYFDHD